MSATGVYEIALYKLPKKADPALLERLQLVAQDGSLLLRDTAGNETPCKETDIASVIASTPALRTVPECQQAQIICGEDILGQLPDLLEPIPDSASLVVNGKSWDAFPTIDGDDVMLPGKCDWRAPEMNPCWAEYRCAEGGSDFENQLVGFSSIGLLTPGIAIEHGRTDYGGNGGAVAVSITSFDDFATAFTDWLLHTPILSGLWQGDRWDITTPDVDLFADAAIATDHEGYWENDDAADEQNDSDDDEDDQGDEWDVDSFANRHLELHLPQELIDRVRARLSAINPEYAAVLDRPEESQNLSASMTLMSQHPVAEGFVGEIGERVRNLIITSVSMRSLSPATILVEGRDPSGHLVKWVTRSKIDAATESITFSIATVKAQETFTGADTTVINAVKIAAFTVRGT